MDNQIKTIAPSESAALLPDLVHVYRQAFGEPPYNKREEEVEEFARSLPTHVMDVGFRLFIAIDPGTERVIGFTYGRTATEGQLWYEMVEAQLRLVGLEGWLLNAFQVSEMAVVPAAQRTGIGGRLFDSLLASLSYERALLTTIAADSAAYRLYTKKGWRDLVREFPVPHVPRPYRIMGLELPMVSKRVV
jgi:GNAT superfamily N-acetyltransferase